LDKRYYVPTINFLNFYNNSLKEDLDVNRHSIFYNKTYIKLKLNSVDKFNMFYYDSKKYDNNSLEFLNSYIYPSKDKIDFRFFNKTNNNIKIKSMNFKLFSQNQLQSFEKFYLNKGLFLADSFEYESAKDQDFSYYFNPLYEEQRQEDWRHYFRVRLPFLGESTFEETNKRASEEIKKPFLKHHPFVELFKLSNNFFRNSNSFKYKGFGDFYFNNRKIPSKLFFNDQNANEFNIKNYLLYNFSFGYYRDKDA
jgi:hypothetical protein